MVTHNPNLIQNIPGSCSCFVPSFNKLEMQNSFVLDGNAAVSVGLQDDFGRPAVIKYSCVGVVQVSSGSPNGEVHRAAVVTFATIETIATEQRRGE